MEPPPPPPPSASASPASMPLAAEASSSSSRPQRTGDATAAVAAAAASRRRRRRRSPLTPFLIGGHCIIIRPPVSHPRVTDTTRGRGISVASDRPSCHHSFSRNAKKRKKKKEKSWHLPTHTYVPFPFKKLTFGSIILFSERVKRWRALSKKKKKIILCQVFISPCSTLSHQIGSRETKKG